jgi:hypothetical protein
VNISSQVIFFVDLENSPSRAGYLQQLDTFHDTNRSRTWLTGSTFRKLYHDSMPVRGSVVDYTTTIKTTRILVASVRPIWSEQTPHIMSDC